MLRAVGQSSNTALNGIHKCHIYVGGQETAETILGLPLHPEDISRLKLDQIDHQKLRAKKETVTTSAKTYLSLRYAPRPRAAAETLVRGRRRIIT